VEISRTKLGLTPKPADPDAELNRLRALNAPKKAEIAARQGQIAAASNIPTPQQVKTKSEAPPPVFDANAAARQQLEEENRRLASTGSAAAPARYQPPLVSDTPAPSIPGESPLPKPPQDQKSAQLEALRKAYIESLGPQEESPEEKALRDIAAKQANLAASEQLGIEKISQQPIPLDFLTGQSAAVQRQAAAQQQALQAQAVPLTDRLVMEQARRTSLQKQRETELGFAKSDLEAQQVTPIEVGGRLVNPRTGEVVYEPPAGMGESKILSPGQVIVDAQGNVIARNDSTTDKFTSVSPGATIIDSKGNVIYRAPEKGAVNEATKSQQAVESLTGKLSLIDSLLTSPGMAGSVGAYGVSRFTPLTADKAERQNFAAGVNQLISQDTLDTLINLKAQGGTLGALSDQERLTLQSAASKIGSWMQRDENGNPTGKFEVSEQFFKDELNKLRTLTESALKRAAGVEAPGGGSMQGVEGGRIVDPNAFLDAFSKGGSVPNNALTQVNLGGKIATVAGTIADRLARADADFFRATGRHFQVNQSYRTHEQQAALYQELSAKGARVAPPGTSFHEKGQAVDVTNWQEAQTFLRKYGLVNDLPDDRGHFSYGETRNIG